MDIKTKHDTSDKVYVYLENRNQYMLGKVESLDITVRCGSVDKITYNIENRMYNPDYSFMLYTRSRDYDRYIQRYEDDVYYSLEELKEDLEKKHRNKMDGLTELKKSWWKNL